MLSVQLATALSVAISVSRTPEALDCPDTEHFTADVQRIAGRAVTLLDTASVVRVEFTRRGSAYEVKVRWQGDREGERALRDEEGTCAALAEAASVTTALLLDPSASSTSRPETLRANGPASHPRWFELWLAARAGGGVGLVSGPNALVGGAVAVSLGPLTTLELAFALTSTHESALGAGNVAARLWFVELGAFRSLTGSTFQLGPSLSLLAGEMHGVGEGYPLSSSASLGWLALGAGARADFSMGSHFRLGARALAVLPARKQSFSVGYVGETEASSAVAGVAEVVAGIRFW